jgi:hypothetical protein
MYFYQIHFNLQAIEREVLAARTRLVGASDPDTLAAGSNLATTLSELGEYSEAIAVQRLVLATQKEMLGEHHRQTMITACNLAATLFEFGEYNEAAEIESSMVAILKAQMGEVGQRHFRAVLPVSLRSKPNHPSAPPVS